MAEEEFAKVGGIEYVNGIKQIQNNGHELMDHTPNHRTNYFTTYFPITDYKEQIDGISKNIDGIDHIIQIGLLKNKICLEFEQIDTNSAIYKGKVNIIDLGASIYIHNYNWSEIAGEDIFYFYFPELDQLVFLPANGIGATQQIEDFWRDILQLNNNENVLVYGFTRDQISLTTESFKVLAAESDKLASHYGFSSLKSWIQPGGLFPVLHKETLKLAFENSDLDFSAGAVYPNEEKQVFNEFNPNNDLNFAMQWGDFLEDEKDLDYNKKIIAQDFAKHYMLIGHSHFQPFDNWKKYLSRTEKLVKWAVNNGIPIKTYAEWADILYFQTPDPYENIFPPLNVDLDENNVPDGYGNIFYPNDYYVGEWNQDTDPSTPDSGYCYEISQVGGIAYVQDLGGIEKGKNNFEIWTKGEAGNTISVSFEYSYHNNNERKTFLFPANTTEWKKYNLSQSLNENKELIVPDTMSTIFIYIECSNYTSGTVKISGMALKKFRESKEHFIELKAYLEGFELNANNNFKDKIPLISPYNEALETLDSIPNKMVDWVLVSLRQNTDLQNFDPKAALEKISKSAIINNEGMILDPKTENNLGFNLPPGNYYVVIKHRNHLPIMSSATIQLE